MVIAHDAVGALLGEARRSTATVLRRPARRLLLSCTSAMHTHPSANFRLAVKRMAILAQPASGLDICMNTAGFRADLSFAMPLRNGLFHRICSSFGCDAEHGVLTFTCINGTLPCVDTHSFWLEDMRDQFSCFQSRARRAPAA
mmetsp:Transcript_4897/g.14833  ORF Transcript_4897/g.14833 Transcript_4897/m.14833 type:complete len:143 (+) Transcript_4897:193-621(+)|eukprot:scaffold279288_cov31-Tisochrysis_lutea.AAC.1